MHQIWLATLVLTVRDIDAAYEEIKLATQDDPNWIGTYIIPDHLLGEVIGVSIQFKASNLDQARRTSLHYVWSLKRLLGPGCALARMNLDTLEHMVSELSEHDDTCEDNPERLLLLTDISTDQLLLLETILMELALQENWPYLSWQEVLRFQVGPVAAYCSSQYGLNLLSMTYLESGFRGSFPTDKEVLRQNIHVLLYGINSE